MKKRYLAFLLALIMLMSLVPAAAFAEDGAPAAETSPEATEPVPAQTPEVPTPPPLSEGPEPTPAAEEPTSAPAAEEPTPTPSAEDPTPTPVTEEPAEPGNELEECKPELERAAIGAFDTSLLGGIPASANPGTGTTKWGVKNGYLCSGNQGKAYSSSTLTLTMTDDAMIRFEYSVSSESYDVFTIVHAGRTVAGPVGGVTGWIACEIDAKSGDVITFTFKKDSSGDQGDDCAYLRSFSTGEAVLISFDPNGGTGEMADQKVYGATALKQNGFTKDHAVFAGWAETPDGEVKYTDAQQIEKPEAALTLYAVWADAWVVSFPEAGKIVNVRKGEAIGEKNVPQINRNGYIFTGWFSGGNKLDPAAPVDADISFAAGWTPISYTVRFDPNGGIGIMDDMTLVYDQSVSLPKSIFVRSGYSFSGWTVSGTRYADEEQISNLTDRDGAIVTFKAEWLGCSVAVRVDLNYETDMRITERTGVVGQNYNYILDAVNGKPKYSAIKDPTRSGYKFMGWFSAPDGGSEITNQYKFTAGDAENGVALYAHWVESVTVSFDPNGGSCWTKSKTVAKGDTLGYLPSASCSGKAFEGWYTEKDGGEKLEATTPINASMTVYAHFRNISYYVRFGANKGSGTMDDVLFEFDRDYNLPLCTFTRKNYVFQGWSESSWSSSVKYKDGAVINREFDDWDSEDGEIYRLYAIWKEDVFGAAFNAIEAALPESNTVSTTGTLGLPESGSGWTAEFSSSNSALLNGGSIVALPQHGSESVMLTVTVTDTATKETSSRSYELTLLSEEAVTAKETLKKAAASLPSLFTPDPHTDRNANDAVERLLAANGYEGVAVSVKARAESYDKYASIAEDGTISYFFNPAMTGRGAYFYTAFVLELNGASTEKELYTYLKWDMERAGSVLKAELDRLTVPAEVSSGTLTMLPRYSVKAGVDADSIDYNSNTDLNTWASIVWQSSDAAYLKIGTPAVPPVYAPYPVAVLPGSSDIKLTLTATMSISTLTDIQENELSISKVFEVTVKPDEEDQREVIKRELAEKLDAALKDPGLRDFATGKPLDAANVAGDIRFPTTRDIGVDGKYQPVTITSSDELTIKTPDVNNSARAEVYRPLPGMTPAGVTVTISITDKETGVCVSRDIDITVSPLTEAEIAAETALMDQVKAHYFDGIKNANTEPDKITTDLRPFSEAYISGGTLVWVYGYEGMTGSGIVPAAMDGWEVEESWRTFRSSNAKVISHENLLVTREKEHAKVTVTSWLSSETLGKYAERYPGDARFAALYRQPVTAELVVLGTDPTTDKPDEKKMNVYFTLGDNGSVWFTAHYDDFSAGATAFDVFTRALADNGYTAEGGKFVTGVSTPGGAVLRNKDRGEYSGWMYSMNGGIPGVVMSEYYISDGDAMVFFYTDDYRTVTGEARYTVEQVIKLIDEIGVVDKSSGDRIIAARRAYDSLSDGDKGKVTNRTTLFAAEKAYAELIRGAAEKFKDIYTETGDRVAAMDEDTLCDFGAEWLIFALARSERELPEIYEAYYDAAVSYVGEKIDSRGRLDAQRATDNARLVIALSALDRDVADVGGHNLLTALADADYVEAQGLSGVIYTLLAFDCRDYDIPAVYDGGRQTTREELVRYILDSQLDDGGWAFSGKTAESDMTAMAIQALAAYCAEKPAAEAEKAVSAAVDKALDCLSAMQTTTGGFTSGGVVTSESAAQVVTALTALGIDPDTDGRFIKNGVSALDSLCGFYVDGGGFAHSADGEFNEFATAQGYYALTAYWRFTTGRTPLYDMSDSTQSMNKAA